MQAWPLSHNFHTTKTLTLISLCDQHKPRCYILQCMHYEWKSYAVFLSLLSWIRIIHCALNSKVITKILLRNYHWNLKGLKIWQNNNFNPLCANLLHIVQDCSISIAKALEILQSCTEPSIHISIWPELCHHYDCRCVSTMIGHLQTQGWIQSYFFQSYSFGIDENVDFSRTIIETKQL